MSAVGIGVGLRGKIIGSAGTVGMSLAAAEARRKLRIFFLVLLFPVVLFSMLYLLSFVVIMIGFIMYCSTPTRTAEVPSTTLPMADSTGFDNLALKIEENHLDSTDTLTTQSNKDNSQAEDTSTKLTAL